MSDNESNAQITLSIDAMGGDFAPKEIVEGCAIFAKKHPEVALILHGDSEKINSIISHNPILKNAKVVHADEVVGMDAKPSQAMRRKNTSMWSAVASVKEGVANAAVSAGNTGALMAVSNLQLRTVPGIHRPAIAAPWPNPKGASVVLDIGANVDSDPDQLVDFAILGEAYAKALFGKEKPSIGLLNVGSEEVKGHEDIKEAMRLLRLHGSSLGMDVYGFVEGNDLSLGTTDVVVTDGFTGNIALKAAEGAAKLFATFLKESLKSNLISKIGAFIATSGFNKLKSKMDPRAFNGGMLLGLNGLVVKSHGGTDAHGFSNALLVALRLASSDYQSTIVENVARLNQLRQVQQKAPAEV